MILWDLWERKYLSIHIADEPSGRAKTSRDSYLDQVNVSSSFCVCLLAYILESSDKCARSSASYSSSSKSPGYRPEEPVNSD